LGWVVKVEFEGASVDASAVKFTDGWADEGLVCVFDDRDGSDGGVASDGMDWDFFRS
jgi:hypothetical protein